MGSMMHRSFSIQTHACMHAPTCARALLSFAMANATRLLLRAGIGGLVGASGYALGASCDGKPPDRLARWFAGWQAGRTGFHLSEVNETLLAHCDEWLEGSTGKTILVPLCGKSVDLPFLADMGHVVVGVEGVRTAVDQFQVESDESLIPSPLAKTAGTSWMAVPRDCGRAGALAIVEADYFRLTPHDLHAVCNTMVEREDKGTADGAVFDFVWDRASLVAIDPTYRQEYARQTAQFLKPGGKILLNTLEYDQQQMRGPPFSVSESEVRRLYEPLGLEVVFISARPARDTGVGKFAALDRLDECVFIITKTVKPACKCKCTFVNNTV